MNSQYEVVPYQPDLRDQVLKLQTRLWSTDLRVNDAYFSWKYERNPYRNGTPAYLALHRGRIIGVRGVFGSCWEAGPGRRQSHFWCVDDLAIEPEHRDRGIFSLIMNTALADLSAQQDGFILCPSAGLVTVLGSLTMGWKRVAKMEPVGLQSPRMERLQRCRMAIDRLPYVWRLTRSRWFDPRGSAGEYARLDRRARRGLLGEGMRLERSPDPVGMAALVGALGHDGRIRHVRDAAYFDWRLRNPLRDYRFLYAGGGGTITGYLVLARSRSRIAGASSIRISDWEASTPEVGAALLRAVARAEVSELVTWAAALPAWGSPVLAEAGFVPVEQELRNRGCPCILVRSLRADLPESAWLLAGHNLLDPASWDFRMLYTMRG